MPNNVHRLAYFLIVLLCIIVKTQTQTTTQPNLNVGFGLTLTITRIMNPQTTIRDFYVIYVKIIWLDTIPVRTDAQITLNLKHFTAKIIAKKRKTN